MSTLKQSDLRKLNLPPLEEIEKELSRRRCQNSFAQFVKEAWHILEPITDLKWGWSVQAICDHLQAVSEGKFNRLLINVPPGCMKSLLTSVFWPAWEWGPAGMPEKRFVGTSHSRDLATRDSMKCRTLIESEWYQARWKVPLKSDQNAKTNFSNQAQGVRESTAFVGITGKRGDRVIVDDPLSAADANSEAALWEGERLFREALPTRVNDDSSAIVVIMQRLHEVDPSGIIIEEFPEYVHLCLPMRFEEERKCKTPIFEDPRKEDGELLFPEFFTQERVGQLEKALGSYASAGQLQQRPVPRSGGLFDREWFEYVQEIPPNTKFVRGWDLAATVSEGAAFTAGVKLGKAPDGRLIVADVERARLSGNGVRTLIKQTAIVDGKQCRVSIPQDPGQAGKAQVSQFADDLQGYDARFSPETGDKITRAMPISSQAEAGNLYLLSADWNRAFVEECAMFPNAKFKDQVDALSRAYAELLKLTKHHGATTSTTGPQAVN